jgi:nucleotide-binding universal stress UspA family protein
MFARILVGYDGSFEAQAALRLALELTRDDGRGRVTAVAVAHLPQAPATVGEVQEERQAREARCRQWLAAAAAYAADCDTYTVIGRTGPALVRAAAGQHADLLVIGATRRRTAWARRLRPGKVPAVARDAPCPVLIAHR